MIINNSIPTSETQNTKQPPLNQILYGSPGTGKTYNTIDRALCILGYGSIVNQKCILKYEKIIDKLQEIKEAEKYKINFDRNNKRSCAKALFDYYRNEGQIEFVTFHQNYGYEEFVEGIKPIEDSEELLYETRSGIFKELCKLAKKMLLILVKHKKNYKKS